MKYLKSNLDLQNYAKNRKRIRSHKVFAVSDSSNKCFNENQSNDVGTLDSAKKMHEEKHQNRVEHYESILVNNTTDLSVKQLFLYTLGMILISFITTLPYSVIPAHDIIQSPEYWYEVIFHSTHSTWIGWGFRSLEVDKYLNIQFFQQKRNMLSIILLGITSGIIIFLITHYIWTGIHGFQYPIPFLGMIFVYPLNILYLIVCWSFFPKKWRQNWSFRKRYGWFVLLQFTTIVASTMYVLIINRLGKSSDKYQPLVALMLPLTRELAKWLCCKLIRKVSSGDVVGATICVSYRISAAYAIILCNILGSVATDQTSWVLIGIDYSLNIHSCLRIVWVSKKNPSMTQKQIDYLQNLALNELIEFTVPLAFLLVLSVTYTGPNGRLFGNILNSYWTYSAIENIYQYLMNTGILFLVDFSSAIICAIILWYSCKIKMWKAILSLQKEFGQTFCCFLARFFVLVSMTIGTTLFHVHDEFYEENCQLQEKLLVFIF